MVYIRIALSSKKLSEKTADKKTVLEYEQSYFNIIYTFFKYYISDKYADPTFRPYIVACISDMKLLVV